MSSKTSNRRQTLMVNSPLQKRMISSLSLMPATALAATTILVCVYWYRLYDEAVSLRVYLGNLTPMFLTVFAFVIFTGIFVVTNALRVSNQVAGPSLNICRRLAQIRDGDISFKVEVREQDHLSDICNALNTLLDTLNENPPAGFRTRQMAGEEFGDGPQGKAGEREEGATSAADGGHAAGTDPYQELASTTEKKD